MIDLGSLANNLENKLPTDYLEFCLRRIMGDLLELKYLYLIISEFISLFSYLCSCRFFVLPNSLIGTIL